jgi:nucleoside phosphorylase
MSKQSETPTIGILSIIGTEQQAIKNALGMDETHRVSGNGRLYYEKVIETNYSGSLRVQLYAQGEPGNNVSAADATRIIGSNVRFMLLCGIAAGQKGKVKIGDVIVPRSIVDTTVKMVEEGEFKPRPMITGPLKGVLQMNTAVRIDEQKWHELFSQLLLERPIPPDGQIEEYSANVADKPTLHESAILSDNLLLRDPQVLIDAANDLHQQIRAGEMEAAGFVRACINEYPPIPWYVIRGISDFGDNLKNDKFQSLAANAVASYLVLYIKEVIDLRIWEFNSSGGISRIPDAESQPFQSDDTLTFSPLTDVNQSTLPPINHQKAGIEITCQTPELPTSLINNAFKYYFEGAIKRIYCRINDESDNELFWGKSVFIPLKVGFNNHVKIEFEISDHIILLSRFTPLLRIFLQIASSRAKASNFTVGGDAEVYIKPQDETHVEYYNYRPSFESIWASGRLERRL